MLRVAILGCGPAGLLAAQAVDELGFIPTIFSRKNKSRMGGAQYLHEHIAGVTPISPEAELRYVYWGDKETYAKKVYGDALSPDEASFGLWEDTVPAWNLTAAYERLWVRNEHRIVDQVVDPAVLERIVASGVFDLILSTIPLPHICLKQPLHSFPSQRIYIWTDAPKDMTGESQITYNGLEWPSWYRASSLWGFSSVEYSAASVARVPPYPSMITTGKPMHTNCDCWPEVVRLGRYGQWSKKVLTHHAYREAHQAILDHAESHGIPL